MAVYEINLIRERTTSPGMRKFLFWGMVVYLALCGAILVRVSNQAAKKLVVAMENGRHVQALERQFRRTGADRDPILAHARRLRDEIASYSGKLEAIGRGTARRLDLAQMMIRLAVPLPDGLSLARMSVDRAEGQIEFDVVAPADRSAYSVTASDLISLWEKDEVLMSRLQRIRAVISERRRMGQRTVLVLQFASPLPAQQE